MSDENAIVLNAEDAEELFMQEENEQFLYKDHTPWIADGKYSHQSCLYTKKDDGSVWAMPITRSGSYHTDWHYHFYGDEKLVRVELKEVCKDQWVSVE